MNLTDTKNVEALYSDIYSDLVLAAPPSLTSQAGTLLFIKFAECAASDFKRKQNDPTQGQ